MALPVATASLRTAVFETCQARHQNRSIPMDCIQTEWNRSLPVCLPALLVLSETPKAQPSLRGRELENLGPSSALYVAAN